MTMNPEQWIRSKVQDAPRLDTPAAKLFLFLQRGGSSNQPTVFEPWEMMYMARILGTFLFELEDQARES